MIRWRTLSPSSSCLKASLWLRGVRSPSAQAPVGCPARRAGRATEADVAPEGPGADWEDERVDVVDTPQVWAFTPGFA